MGTGSSCKLPQQNKDSNPLAPDLSPALKPLCPTGHDTLLEKGSEISMNMSMFFTRPKLSNKQNL